MGGFGKARVIAMAGGTGCKVVVVGMSRKAKETHLCRVTEDSEGTLGS